MCDRYPDCDDDSDEANCPSDDPGTVFQKITIVGCKIYWIIDTGKELISLIYAFNIKKNLNYWYYGVGSKT